MWANALWIGVPKEEYAEKKILQNDANNRFVYFTHAFDLTETGTLEITITACSRYRLWINGRPVFSGPCRGDQWHHYYEEADVSVYLKTGTNFLAVQVLLADFNAIATFGDENMPLISIAERAMGHRLALEGQVIGDGGAVLHDVTTGTADWKCFLEDSFRLSYSHPCGDNLGAVSEVIDFTKSDSHWKKDPAVSAHWRNAIPLERTMDPLTEAVGLVPALPLQKRPIPLPEETEAEILGEEITVPANARKKITIDCGDYFSAYMQYRLDGGANGKVSFAYFERYVAPEEQGQSNFSPFVRDDSAHGVMPSALRDEIVLSGGAFCFEPFWYRTMRFLRITVETCEEPLTIKGITARKTAYPLHPETGIRSSAAWVEPLYRMCEKTLQNCMMDAYMDCPYYEQMQYPMDARLQALFTYVSSSDTKLARKALEDFHTSLTPYGYIQGRAPSGYRQIISTFSLFYIEMLYEYYQHTRDAGVLKHYRADVDIILNTFDEAIGESGLVEHLTHWQFVDWLDDWKEIGGKPRACLNGPSAVINLMYASALETGAKIAEESGRSSLAGEYRERRERILTLVKETCFDPVCGMIREGKGLAQYYQLTQAYAVLCGIIPEDKAAGVLEKTFRDASIFKCNFSTSYVLFRALEKVGRYDLMMEKLQDWIHLIDDHCLTCPETPFDCRSECHGWSALPMFELIRTFAGIREEKDRIVISPHLEDLNDLSGTAVTRQGKVGFAYRKEGENCRVELQIPVGMHAVYVSQSGEERELIGCVKFSVKV